jgi:hypothetical protein
MATKTFQITKDNISRHRHSGPGDGPSSAGVGDDSHWLCGRYIDTSTSPDSSYDVWTTAQMDLDWSGVGRVTSALLTVFGTSSGNGQKHLTMGTNGIAIIKGIAGVNPWSEGNNSEDHWSSNEYLKPSTSDSSPVLKFTNVHPGSQDFDIMRLLQWWGPKTGVKFRVGTQDLAGLGHLNRGFRLYGDETSAHACEFYGDDAGNSARRPIITIIYEPVSTKPSVTRVSPSGSVNDAPLFQAQFADTDPDDRLAKFSIEVRRVSNGDSTWNPDIFAADSVMASTGMAAVNAPAGRFPAGQQQEWRVRVQEGPPGNEWSDWTAWGLPFTVTGSLPVCTTRSIGTVPNMAQVHFRADVTSTQPLASVRIQLRPTTVAGSPLWDGPDNAWDTGDDTVRANEKVSGGWLIDRTYEGSNLLAGGYSWRVMVIDQLGVASAWSYGTLTLTADWDDPDTAIDNIGWSALLSTFRIVLRRMGTNRGPGVVRAIIEDAFDVGASTYVSAPGECHFSLTQTHPQVSECEPYQTHYEFQQYRNGSWFTMFAGVLTDFDATGDNVVISGVDYLGMLHLDVERRSGTRPYNDTPAGAKYTNKDIRLIIRDQLEHARDMSNSTTGFISVPPNGTKFQAMPTEVVINASYKPRLEFIRGLIDSYRAGTGNRSRLLVKAKPNTQPDFNAAGPSYEYQLLADSGIDRPALRMEYGGIIQGFRIIALGDFSVAVLGVGRKVSGLEVFYQTGTSALSQATWGNLTKAAVWQDVDDANDLKRRATQMASEASRVGKRLALGFRVASISPFDGWDLTDSVPVSIERGVVNTNLYAPDTSGEWIGLSWWTIWGCEWRFNPDGHDELTMVMRPREDKNTASSDLLVAKPFYPVPEWRVGHGPPTAPP